MVSLRRWALITCIAFALAAAAAPAFGYDEIPPTSTECVECHGVFDPLADPEASGPHGGYLTTTNKCAACHSVHVAAADGVLLLPAATIKSTCETCHDGSGGGGVYGVLAARIPSVPVAAAHRVIDTNPGTIVVVPGGASNGDDSTEVFSGAGGNLTCTDCHSPHGTSIVNEFTGDRSRTADSVPSSSEPRITSARLLKQVPTSYSGDPITEYGSDWCGACHVGRLSGSGMANNHPVESTVNPPESGLADLFYYDRVARVTGVGVSTTEIATMGGSNGGYVMPDLITGRTTEQDGHDPICQQCHEDARGVGNDLVNNPQRLDNSPSEAFSVTALDGTVTTDNPRFQVFPHESQVASFLVEDGALDGLCLNCHDPAMLP